MTTRSSNNSPVTAGEVAALARAVGSLSQDVGSLRSTLLRAVEQSHEAQQMAQKAQSATDALGHERLRSLRWIRVTVTAFVVAFLLAAGTGVIAWHAYKNQQRDLKAGQYQTCVERNNQGKASAAFLRDYILAVARHDPATAREVAAVIAKYQAKAAPLPDCTRILSAG